MNIMVFSSSVCHFFFSALIYHESSDCKSIIPGISRQAVMSGELQREQNPAIIEKNISR